MHFKIEYISFFYEFDCINNIKLNIECTNKLKL